MKNDHGVKQKDLIVRMLSALFPEAKIYLFGSRARGAHKFHSDIDLAVDMGRKMDLSEIAMAKNVLEAVNILRKVDVVDVNNVPEALRESIIKDGILWKD
jgi:predicted nucleotidyltransferase